MAPASRPFAVAALLFVAGCSRETGMLLQVTAGAKPALVRLDFRVGRQTWCERWILDGESLSSVDVSGRDLTKSPYALLLHPLHTTDLSRTIRPLALAYSDSGLVGVADFGEVAWQEGDVLEHRHAVEALAHPEVVHVDDAGGGCVCLPGVPWLGNGTPGGCDDRVIPSLAAYGDLNGCDLHAAVIPLSVCDGQLYGAEIPGRTLPCFVKRASGQCAVAHRSCSDTGGVAYDEDCDAGKIDATLGSSTVCDAYLACEQSACTDPLACLKVMLAANSSTLTCTVEVDPKSAAGMLQPCPNRQWQGAFNTTAVGADCTAAVLDGTQQAPFTLGLAASMQSGAQTVASSCPPTLEVDSIDVPTIDDLPSGHDFDILVGDRLVHVHLIFRASCGGASGIQCQ
jgi:hypothetical protein